MNHMSIEGYQPPEDSPERQLSGATLKLVGGTALGDTTPNYERPDMSVPLEIYLNETFDVANLRPHEMPGLAKLAYFHIHMAYDERFSLLFETDQPCAPPLPAERIFGIIDEQYQTYRNPAFYGSDLQARIVDKIQRPQIEVAQGIMDRHPEVASTMQLASYFRSQGYEEAADAIYGVVAAQGAAFGQLTREHEAKRAAERAAQDVTPAHLLSVPEQPQPGA
jgi:hypothetical protein